MQRYILVTLIASAISFAAWLSFAPQISRGYGQEILAAETQLVPLKPIMQRKLDHAKGVLEGLAMEDFELIAREAQALSLLSLESNWNVLTTEEYIQQSSDFRRAVNVITQAAHEKDVHRAALGYVNLTVRCVECHSYLRKKARVGNPVDSSK